MNLFADIPFRSAPITGRLNYPGHSLTLVVKGAFDMSAGTAATMAEKQLPPCGDEFYPGDEEMAGAPRYESDFAYFKPRADLLLVGKCHSPGGAPLRTCQATFRVGDKARVLTIIGNRQWERSGLSWQATHAEPFTELELRYDHAFGGLESKKNPVGKGDSAVEDIDGNEIRPLPNIEDPHEMIESRKSRPAPAGFGPLGRLWEMRLAKMGTYTGKYLETRWPWVPEDFDWTHFNAAPEAMQLDGYLRGDEELYFENLHPVHARYQSRLPGQRVRCFVNRLAAPDAEHPQFVEVPMSLDTLWIDMEAEKLVLVWRGWTEVSSEDHEEVQDVFITSEPLEQPPASVEQCYQRFLDERAEEEKVWTAPQDQPEPPEPPESAPAQDQAQPDRAHLEAQANAVMAQMGIDVEGLPPEVREKQARIFEKLAEGDPAKASHMELDDVDARLREALAKLDLDPDHLPPVTAKAKAEQLRFMKELGVTPPDLSVNPEVGRVWAMTAAALPKMGMDPENLDPLIDLAKKQQQRMKDQFGLGDEEESEHEAPVLTREVVAERAARGESFAGENLRGLDLSGLEMAGLDLSQARLDGAMLTDANLQAAILARADLTGADLSGANLTAANLAGSDLSEAKIERADLTDADLTAANLSGARLVGASLTDAIFAKAMMPGAMLDRVKAKDAIFFEADLTGASLTESICAGADFSGATLDQATFKGAQLTEASMQGAVARQISLEGSNLTGLQASGNADFTGSILWRSSGAESIWDGADLTECDFRGSEMQNATFTSACLKKANLSATNMKFSRFDKADLREANLIYMNLFQGSLEKANLTDANLSRANMYEVEFLGAVVDRTQLIGANLNRTKLEQP